MARRLLILSLVLPVVASCTVLGPAVMRASDAYEDAFVPLENIGRFDRWRLKATPQKLLSDGQAFSLMELGRRSETGEGGLPRDRVCAAYWYEEAFRTPYEEPHSTYGGKRGVSAHWMQTRTRLPQARVAYRKLLKGGPIDAQEVMLAADRCRNLAS